MLRQMATCPCLPWRVTFSKVHNPWSPGQAAHSSQAITSVCMIMLCVHDDLIVQDDSFLIRCLSASLHKPLGIIL